MTGVCIVGLYITDSIYIPKLYFEKTENRLKICKLRNTSLINNHTFSPKCGAGITTFLVYSKSSEAKLEWRLT
jgi:hypothetical protein